MLILVLVQIKSSGATWMIFRDEHSFFIDGGNCTISFVEDRPTTEAMELRDGLMMVEAMGYSNLGINLDCVEVTGVMKNGGHTHDLKIACFFLESLVM
jgi:hypothetical protein